MVTQRNIKMLWAMLAHLLLTTIYCLLPTDSIAQITFEKTYGGPADDVGNSIQQTSDGGYIIAGYTYSFGTGSMDIHLIKTDSLGDTIWTKIYGGTGADGGNSVQQTSDRGYIITGFTESFGAGGFDVYLIKADSLGDTLWTKTYGGTLWEWGQFVQQTSDNGFIVTGYTNSYGSGFDDVYLIKTDSLGDTNWTRTYGGIDNEQGYSIQQTFDGGYIIAGATTSFGAGSHDVYLIKTNLFGNTLWTNTFGGVADDKGYSVQQVSDGGFIIAGMTWSFGAGQVDLFLIRTNNSGDTIWTKTFGGPFWDWGNSVRQTTDGGYIITGLTFLFGADSYDIYLSKTDSLGNSIWTKTFGGPLRDWGYSVVQTLDGGYAITGYINTPGAYNNTFLIKTDANGIVGVEEEEDNEQLNMQNVRLLQNQPNPFHHSTLIRYIIPVDSRQKTVDKNVSLNIYDITGRLVKILVDERQESGVYQVQWDGKDQGSGVYFYRLTVGVQNFEPLHDESSPYIETKKLILLK